MPDDNGYSDLRKQLVDFFRNLSLEKRQNSNNVIQITQHIYDGVLDKHLSTIKTIIRVRDLYVIRVTVYDSEEKYVWTQTADGKNDNYAQYEIECGFKLVPYRHFHEASFYKLPGSLLVSQAVFISEAVRFSDEVFNWTRENRWAAGFVKVEGRLKNIIKSWSKLSKEKSKLVEIPKLDSDDNNNNK